MVYLDMRMRSVWAGWANELHMFHSVQKSLAAVLRWSSSSESDCHQAVNAVDC